MQVKQILTMGSAAFLFFISVEASNKVSFVTGVSRGIGLELAKKLLEHDICVVGVSRTSAECMKERLEHPNFIYINADITTHIGLQQIKKCIEDKQYKFDYIVHNAGVMMNPQTIEDLSWDEMENVINTNLLAPMKLSKVLIPHCNQGAKMMFVTSRAATTVVAQAAPYCVSKAGLNMLAHILHKEVSNYKISIALVIPGEVDTSIQKILRESSTFALQPIFYNNYVQNQLISPEVCAQFLSWLLCETSVDVFEQNEPWNIYDVTHHHHWLKGYLPVFPF
jgi:short-subunit dehydrogenase